MFWKVVLTIGAITFLAGAADVVSAGCSAVEFGGNRRSVTYACVPEGTDGAMSPGAAGGLMFLASAGMLCLAWGPSLYRRSRDQSSFRLPVYGGADDQAGSNALDCVLAQRNEHSTHRQNDGQMQADLLHRVQQHLNALPERPERRQAGREMAVSAGLSPSSATCEAALEHMARADAVAVGFATTEQGTAGMLLLCETRIHLFTPAAHVAADLGTCILDERTDVLTLGSPTHRVQLAPLQRSAGFGAATSLEATTSPDRDPVAAVPSADSPGVGVVRKAGSDTIGLPVLTRLLRDGVISEEEYESTVRALRSGE